MEKIIKAALAASYPELNLDALMFIINATPNPVIATEILLGVYEKPMISDTPKNPDRLEKSKKNIKFKKFDTFQNVIHYTYNRVNTVEGFVKKGVTPTVETIEFKSRWITDAAKDANLSRSEFDNIYEKVVIQTDMLVNPDGSFKEFEDYCGIDVWEDYK